MFHIFIANKTLSCCTILNARGGNMDVDFVRSRITQLRMQKGVSEYKMSYDLGHSRGYVNNISSGKVLPSMSEFYAICSYFDITPAEFFNEQNRNPGLISEIIKSLYELSDDDLNLTLMNIKRLLE